MCNSLPGKSFFRLTLVVLASLLATTATAQDGRTDAQRFNPAQSQYLGYFSQPSALVLHGGQWDIGLLVNYADDPLVLENFAGEEVSSLVSAQATANIVGAIGIGDMFQIGVDIPLVLFQEGDEILFPFNLDASDAGFGLGNIRIVPQYMFLGPESLYDPSGIAMSFLVDVSIPTGDSDSYQGGGFGAEPGFAFDYIFNPKYRLGATLGYAIRTSDETLLNFSAGDALKWSLAASIQLADPLDLVPVLSGDALLGADHIDVAELPMEGLLGLKYEAVEGLILELAGGAGIIRGAGAPDYRFVLGVSYTNVPHPDTDGDGYDDPVDGCPEQPEDFDDFEDEDGCPDPDNDGDGIFDVDDACPDIPEDFDGFADEDGCPDPDNDGDGILDVDDDCPDDPEDLDGFEDEDGCPDPDNDQDTILDINDLCPLEPETFNDIDDEDGCPDMVVLTCTAIELGDKIYFEYNSDVILERSFGLLNNVATLLNAVTEVKLVRIGGHTDHRGSDEYNLELSDRRALAVLRYLVDRGTVDETRLQSRGYGESRPIADNESEEGMAENRRVEFVVLEQDGCDPPADID